MKDISLIKVEELRVVAESKINQVVKEFFAQTDLLLYVDSFSQSTETRGGTLVTVGVKTKVIIE